MAAARRYRLVGAWALIQIVAGCLMIFAGALAALAVLLPWPADIPSRVPAEWRSGLAPAVTAAAVVAAIFGGSLVLSGQLLLLLRDIHRRVARLDARDARRGRDSARAPDRQGAASRLLPRR
jgi:hypothetical protein